MFGTEYTEFELIKKKRFLVVRKLSLDFFSYKHWLLMRLKYAALDKCILTVVRLMTRVSLVIEG